MIRNEIPAANRYTYLSNAFCGPLHPVVYRHYLEFSKRLYLGDLYVPDIIEECEEVRQKIALELNCSKNEIAFVPSTSVAMNYFAMIAARELPKSSEILSLDSEFPSTTLPWLKQGFKINFIKAIDGNYSKDLIISQITKNTKILVCSHVAFQIGLRLSLSMLKFIANEYNLILITNCTQSMFSFKIDSTDLDFACASVHKRIMSGIGCCVIKISSRYLDKLPIAGWMSQKNGSELNNKILFERKEASAIEGGCINYMQVIGIGKMID